MKKEKRLPVIFKGNEYWGISKFDCHTVKLQDVKGGSSYFTSIPISPLSYRGKNPTRAFVKIEVGKLYTVFNISCDWGKMFVMEIPNTMKKEIETATKAAKKAKLL